MKKEIYLALLGLIAGELIMFSDHLIIGISIHIINLHIITLSLVLSNISNDMKNVLQALLILLLMQIIIYSMPQLFTLTLLRYPLVYGVMFISIFYVIRHQNIDSNELGFNFKRLHIYLPLALFIGTVFALIEYNIFRPVPLITKLTFANFFLLSFVMFIFVAAVEELIFRSILQTRLQKVFGINKGILLGAILFGLMHAGYGLVNYIIFTTLSGVVLGYLFHMTRNFPFILMIHGTANVLLFGILPILLV